MPFRLETERLAPCANRRRPTRWIFGLAVLLLGGGMAGAQIQVGLSLEHHAYLKGERFPVRVRIANRLDVPMVFADDYRNAELLIELIPPGRAEVNPVEDRRVIRRQTVIMPGEEAMEMVELPSVFSIWQTGSYRLRAAVRYQGHLYGSPSLAFDLVNGIEVHALERSLPGYDDITLQYSLRYWKRGGGEEAFMVITDKKQQRNYGTFRLGPMVRVHAPAIRFDGKERTIVVHQSGRNRYTRSVVTADRDGAALLEQTHHLPDGNPYPAAAETP